MATTASDQADESRIEARLAGHIPDDLDPRTAAALAAFAQAFVRRLPAEDLEDVPEDELFAEIEDAFRFLASRGDRPLVVRVFDPDPQAVGYHAEGTIVQIVTDDMPFLVDSVTNVLDRHRFHLRRSIHPVIGVVRADDGTLVDIVPARHGEHTESFQHHELDRRLPEAERAALEQELREVLEDVRAVVHDFDPLRGAIDRMIELARHGVVRYTPAEVDEAVDFLEWLRDDNFVFLGYREYEIIPTDAGPAIHAIAGSGLGILRDDEASHFATPVPLSELPPDLRVRYEEGDLLVVTKTNRHATVHRDARMDYIGVRHIGPDGRVVGEGRLLGLFTSKAYMTEAASIPILRRKLEAILEAEDVIEGSHDYKLLVQLFDSFPKDDLFASSVPDLRRNLVALLGAEERHRVRLFVRKDLLLRSVSVLVVLPRDVFNADLRRKLQDLFLDRFGGSAVDYRLSLGESGDARLHFTIWIEHGQVPDVPFDELEAEVLELARTWDDRVAEALALRIDEDLARDLAERWCPRFPDYYRASTQLPVVAGDIVALEELYSSGRRILVGIQNEVAAGEQLTRIAIYRRDGKMELSQVLPLLEDLGLRVVEEVPTRLVGGDGETFIHDFGVLGPQGTQLDVPAVADRVAASIVACLTGEAESDPLHRLLVTSGLDHHQITVLRAYRRYWRLVKPVFSEGYINATLASHPEIAHNLIRLFEARFGPEGDEGTEATLRSDIVHDLDAVASIDEDRILRSMLNLIDATIRTNAFRSPRRSLALKFRSDRVPDMPAPRPLYEIFVYSPDVEGVHLRGGRVARGGIRWSDRMEDYRTEVLGLMKAQMTKNAVIVPTGAKGGFVLRRARDGGVDFETVREAYSIFIEGLLDITDNLVKGEVRHPEGVRVHDGPDPYLVVAADKGTARLSDTANEIALRYGFWLGDAFASGGSAGYDHKALGITAKGAWESVRRHFLELGVDVDRDPVTVVGIGDMSGDVFGNGMLRSRTIELVAAFDHRHIFIDPNPDPARSFDERARLFALPGSSWDDYDRSLISEGGGVWSRATKSIPVSEQARRVLGIDRPEMAPHELIQAILTAPVDLLWNGGIGTYVKARTETSEMVQDRSNDAVRVNGADLRCRVVGEGGNLGFTQLGRIEFARAGGHIYADFIDNSGGVHCSDREVNLKILLGLAMERDEIDRTERDEVVAGAADEVVEAVVYSNFLQAQILAQEKVRSRSRIDTYEDLMVQLEDEGLLDRELEFLPSTEEMLERSREGVDMASPELAVLLAYAKRSLTNALVASGLPDDPVFQEDLVEYFPPSVTERFSHLLADHPLRRELIATTAANEVIDSEGVTFVSRLGLETGAGPANIVRAYRVARGVTDADVRWHEIEQLGAAVPPSVAHRLLAGVDDLVEAVTRWYLGRPNGRRVDEEIGFTRGAFASLADQIRLVGPEEWRRDRDEMAAQLIDAGVPPALARRHAYEPELVHGPDIIDLARLTDRPIEDVARIFFRVGRAFKLDWLEEQVRALPAETRWQRYAIRALGDDLLLLRRQLAERVLATGETLSADEAVDVYLLERRRGEGRLIRFMRLLARDGVTDAAAAVVAIRQIRSLVG